MKTFLLCIGFLFIRLHAVEQLYIVCSVPELADMVQTIGGDLVKTEALVRPNDNAHFLNARPSFVRKIANADAFVVVGMDLEVGWAPALVRGARNQRVQVGQIGYIDCSSAITALEVPTGNVNRSDGDVHPHGNPHYLLSPRCGIQVLHLLGERLALLDPDHAVHYRERAFSARTALAQALYGEAAVTAYGIDNLLQWHADWQWDENIKDTALGGWMAALRPLAGVALIDDHKQWPYFADCFQLNIVAHLEPKAGIPPSSQHLKTVINTATQQKVRAIITAPWFDPRHAQVVAKAASIPVLSLAHQSGSLADTNDYKSFYAYNVGQLKTLIAQP